MTVVYGQDENKVGLVTLGNPPDSLGGGGSGGSSGSGDDSGSGGGGGGGGWGSGGYGGGSGGADAAAGNLNAIANFNQDIAKEKAKQGYDILGDSMKAANGLKKENLTQVDRTANANWYKQLQNLQHVYASIRHRMGNMAYGSGIMDTLEPFKTADDQMDVDVLNAMRNNAFDAYANWYSTIASDVQAYNELASNTQASLAQNQSDLAAQLSNIGDDYISSGDYSAQIKNGELKKDNDIWKYYERNRMVMPSMPSIPFFRPDTAAATAKNRGLAAFSTSETGSANKDYWGKHRLSQGYEHRVGR